MIETVSTVSTISAALRALPAGGASAVADTVENAVSLSRDFVASRIRVDNLQDVAILEYRNEEGEVVRQYPTEKQIEAFKRAQQLEQRSRAQTVSAQQSTQQLEAALGEPAPAPAPAPQEAPAPEASSSGGETSTQSIEV